MSTWMLIFGVGLRPAGSPECRVLDGPALRPATRHSPEQIPLKGRRGG